MTSTSSSDSLPYFDFTVEYRVRIGWQCFPVCQRPIEHFAFRSELTVLKELVCHLVRRDHAHLGAALDGHVADCQTTLDVQTADRTARVVSRVDGMISEVLAEVGDTVAAGDPLAKLETDD